MLRDFLRQQAGRRFRYGQHDCGLLLADWVLLVKGFDPGAQFRGRYHDVATLDTLAAGNLRALFAKAFGARLASIDVPRLGDIALILLNDRRPRGAIRTQTGLVTVSENGLWGIRLNVPILASWEL